MSTESSGPNWAKLAEPFPFDDLEWRIQSSGKASNGDIWARVLVYVTNRAIMERLDAVVGPANWSNEFVAGPAGGVVCRLSVRVDGEWIVKCDGAENTDIEGVKGGLSGAMKRAAVQWGIGRYLYGLGEFWAEITTHGGEYAKTKDNTVFRWKHPGPDKFPAWALPGGAGAPTQEHDHLGDFTKAMRAVQTATREQLAKFEPQIEASDRWPTETRAVLIDALIARKVALDAEAAKPL